MSDIHASKMQRKWLQRGRSLPRPTALCSAAICKILSHVKYRKGEWVKTESRRDRADEALDQRLIPRPPSIVCAEHPVETWTWIHLKAFLHNEGLGETAGRAGVCTRAPGCRWAVDAEWEREGVHERVGEGVQERVKEGV